MRKVLLLHKSGKNCKKVVRKWISPNKTIKKERGHYCIKIDPTGISLMFG